MTDPRHLSLVIPVHNAARQLPATLSAVEDYMRRRPGTEVVFVDDASTELQTVRQLQDFARSTRMVTVLRNRRNMGKGFSVTRGMLQASGTYRVFTDVDLAYPIDEVDKILRELESGSDVAIGCRVMHGSRYLMSPTFFHYLYTRHLMSRAFNTFVRLTLLPGVLDTQAGLKGFTSRAAHAVFSRATVAGFSFDVECLYIAQQHGFSVTPVPVAFRYDDEPSTVHFVRDSVRMARDVARVRVNGWRGVYRRSVPAAVEGTDAVRAPERTAAAPRAMAQ
jgi:dolichyl-phosphate beta-glucosyltransferase